ncbi:MAG: spermidine/putrescine ABC transporter substrate-binding protein, partial [Phascolarctobacterium sp.]|nr:spermidine/putrescine ABC transporter substrate-binding protein [Phascolarctobacterium sp.]
MAEKTLICLEKERDVLMKTSLKMLALACCLALVTGCGGGDQKKEAAKQQQPSKEAAVLNVYGWADYFDPALLEEFEKQNKCKVTYDVFGNNEELLAKMQAGGAQYDVIMPSDYMVTTMTKLDMLAKLDFKNIPNAKNIDPKFKNTVYDPKNEFTVPFVWGMTGIVYNKKYIKEAPTKWDDLWKPEYKGHLIVLNEVREHFNMALKKHGYSNNSKDPKELEIAFKDLQ